MRMFGEPGAWELLLIPSTSLPPPPPPTHTHTHTHTELQSELQRQHQLCEQQHRKIVEKEERLQRYVPVVLFSSESCNLSYS